MAAKINAYGVMNFRVSKDKLIKGTWKVGNPALMPSPPPATINDLTVSVFTSPKTTMRETVMIAINAAGSFFVNFGRNTIIAMVKPTKPSMVYMAEPSSH